jgi:hypothetical protein
MKQPRFNVRGSLVIPSSRNPSNTNEPFTTMAERDTLIQKYWSDLSSSEPIANDNKVVKLKLTKTVIDNLTVDGKILILVQEIGTKNVTAQFLRYNGAIAGTAEASPFYYFVLEQQHIYRRLASDFDPDGIAYAVQSGKRATHLAVRFGKKFDSDNDTWYYVFVNACNFKNNKFEFITDHDGAGGEPPGSSVEIP